MNVQLPRMNLFVIRSKNIDQAVEFYSILGILFNKEQHGNGPVHYSAVIDGFVFEIYPLREMGQSTTDARFGFSVDAVDERLPELVEMGAKIIDGPHDSQWGRRAVIRDLDGHIVELLYVNAA